MRSLALSLALLACPLAAQEPSEDASRRLHDAYVLEVVEGKVPEAARLYLALLGEVDLPPMVRAQAELRFAACCAVLGRADEARARLAALATRDDLPAGLRAEVEEYRRGLEGVGAGTAFDEKLEQMVFELGRARYELVDAGMQPEPEVYRDFAILGQRGWPTLRKVLDHPDASLQSQAFLLLCRMDAPEMAVAWRPETMAAYVAAGFSGWLKRHRDALPAVENRLRELPAPTAEHWVSSDLAKAGLSPAFLQESAERGLDPQTVVNAASYAGAEGARLIRGWIGDTPLGVRACCRALAIAASDSRERWTAEEERLLVLRASMLLSRARPKGRYGSFLGVVAKRYEPALALEGMKRVLDYWESAEFWDSPAADADSHEFLHDLVAGLAGALVGRDLDGQEARKLRERIDAWLVRRPSMGEGVLPKLVRQVLPHLSDADAALWIRTLFERGGEATQGALVGALDPRDARQVPWFVEALGVCDPKVVHHLLATVGNRPPGPVTITPECAAALRVVLPELYRRAGSNGMRIAWMTGLVFRPLGAEKAREAYLALVRELARDTRGDSTWWYALVTGWFGPNQLEAVVDTWMREEVVIPVYANLLGILDGAGRQQLCTLSVQWLGTGAGSEHARQLLASEVMAAAADLSLPLLPQLVRMPDLFPYEDWVPRVPGIGEGTFRNLPVPRDGAQALAARLVTDPSRVELSLLYVLQRGLPGDELRELLSSLLRRCRPETLPALLALASPATVDPGAAEQTLLRFATVDNVDTVALGGLALLVAQVRASDKLIPVARRLLGSEDPAAVTLGVTLARKLGRTELIEQLVAVLDSPDANLRSAAKDAIESIREWQRFRNETATTPR